MDQTLNLSFDEPKLKAIGSDEWKLKFKSRWKKTEV